MFASIADAGQDAHWAYDKGMSRLSCMFCIMASPDDLKISAELNPETYSKYVAMEKRIGFTMMMNQKSLEDVTGIKARG